MGRVKVDINQIQLDQQPSTNQEVLDVFAPESTTPGRKKVDINQIELDPVEKPQQEAPGFMSRVGDKIGDRLLVAKEAGATRQPPARLLLRTGGAVAGSINDIVGEGIKSGIDALPESVHKGAKATADYIATNRPQFVTDTGEAFKRGAGMIADKYQGWAKENPNAAQDVADVANIAGIAPFVKPAAKLTEGTGNVLTKVGGAIEDSAEASALAKKNSFVADLVSPKDTPSVRSDQFSRSKEKGLFRQRVTTPTAQEKAVIDTVSELPVSNNKSLLANYNIIAGENAREAESLMAKLKQNDVQISPNEVDSALQFAVQELKKNPFITGDAELTAQRVIQGMQNVLGKNEYTASGLLQARKDFDAWVKSQKGAGVFDPSRDTAVTVSVQKIRQTINDLVESKLPDAGYKKSLQKQSNLYRAMENLEDKGAYEAPSLISRTMQKASDLIPVKNAIAKTALVGAGAGAAIAAPVALAGAGAAYGAAKVISSPIVRKGVGAIIKGTGKALKGSK